MATDREQRLLNTLDELLSWERHMGGWEASCWSRAKKTAEDLRKDIEMTERKPWIVCAACRDPRTGFIAAGPRHFDDTMHRQIDAYFQARGEHHTQVHWDQGFIDQHGQFYDRGQAMRIVKENGQPFDIKRNGGYECSLFSEGLY